METVGTIYFIDEDVFQNRPFRIALELRGFIVKEIDNADDGLEAMLHMLPTDRAIVDVMLGTLDGSRSSFDRASTENYMKTGLILARQALSQLGSSAASRMVFFTNAGVTSDLWRSVDETAGELNVSVLQKGAYGSPRAFVEKLMEIGFLPRK